MGNPILSATAAIIGLIVFFLGSGLSANTPIPGGEPAGELPEESFEDSHEVSGRSRDMYKQPVLMPESAPPETRNFGVGIGTMGGYGLAALDFRGKVPTNNSVLPWVGLELGGGWTPPGVYQITVGPVGDVTDENNKWRILSWAGAVLLYFHRWHYLPVRTGWDIGRGVYFMLGYGFEHLNGEGFFSWGVEAGILTQPWVESNIENLVNCGQNTECSSNETWPVIPYVRFSLHFYLV